MVQSSLGPVITGNIGPDYYNMYFPQTGTLVTESSAPYTGPVAGITGFLEMDTDQNINIDATSLNPSNQWVDIVGYGMDSINMAATTGGNLLDGDYNSCFLTGSMNLNDPDTFYVNTAPEAGLKENLWSTIVNFHAGDVTSIWADVYQDFSSLIWLNNQGAPGYTGLTGVFQTHQGPLAAVTLVGYSTADLTNGRLSVTAFPAQNPVRLETQVTSLLIAAH